MKIKVYHSSPSINRAYIRVGGLLTVSRKKGKIQYGPRIFLSTKQEDMGIKLFNYKENDLWEVEVEEDDLKPDETSKSENHFYVEHRINAKHVKLIKAAQYVEKIVSSDI